MNSPGSHGADAGGVFGDDGLEHHEGEAGRPVSVQLLQTQGELARSLADRVRKEVT
jgi:hypothetical protein